MRAPTARPLLVAWIQSKKCKRTYYVPFTHLLWARRVNKGFLVRSSLYYPWFWKYSALRGAEEENPRNMQILGVLLDFALSDFDIFMVVPFGNGLIRFKDNAEEFAPFNEELNAWWWKCDRVGRWIWFISISFLGESTLQVEVPSLIYKRIFPFFWFSKISWALMLA